MILKKKILVYVLKRDFIDEQNMSLEQLKERAARMNREREEKTAQDLEKRNSVIRETEEKKEEEAKKEVRLNIQWSVSLRIIILYNSFNSLSIF